MTTRRVTFMGWLVCLLLTVASVLPAQTGLKIQLVSEVKTVVPGKPFYVGLFLQHEPGFHTYYRQPGIVGVPTAIRWHLPEGFQAGELEYPAPETTLMFKIRAQGYERDLLLQCRITPPATLPVGSRVNLSGLASWMCCGNTCHPGSKELTIELPVAERAEFDDRWQPIFEAERARYPQRSDAWEIRAEERGTEVTLHLKPSSALARPLPTESIDVYFFTEDGWINTDEPQMVERVNDGSLKLILRRADVYLGKGTPTRLLGVVRRDDGWLANGSLPSLIVDPELRR